MLASFTRRELISRAILQVCAVSGVKLAAAQERVPLLRKIKMATVGAYDLAAAEQLYVQWLGYTVSERGAISPALAGSWNAPDMQRRPFISLRPQSGADVFIRVVGIDSGPVYEPLTTFGWNAIEIIVDDVDKLFQRLRRAPYRILGAPQSLGGSIASVRAMQILGPSQELVYLTCETGDRNRSTLPTPKSFVDRPFIMVLAGADLPALENFYGDRLGLRSGGKFSMPGPGGAGKDNENIISLSLVRCAEKGNSIELDRAVSAAKPRPRTNGQLPSGVAVATFSVEDLSSLDLPFITKPQRHYGSARSATLVGPAGELLELIEEPT